MIFDLSLIFTLHQKPLYNDVLWLTSCICHSLIILDTLLPAMKYSRIQIFCVNYSSGVSYNFFLPKLIYLSAHDLAYFTSLPADHKKICINFNCFIEVFPFLAKHRMIHCYLGVAFSNANCR